MAEILQAVTVNWGPMVTFAPIPDGVCLMSLQGHVLVAGGLWGNFGSAIDQYEVLFQNHGNWDRMMLGIGGS